MGQSRDQPDYVNAVACVKTALAPEQLLDLTQALNLSMVVYEKKNAGVHVPLI